MFFKKCASLELNPCETLPSALRSNLDMCALMCCKLLRSAELLHTSNWTALNYICLKVTSATKLIVHCTRDFEIIIFHLLPKKNDSKQLLRIQMTGYYEPAVLYADDPCVDPARCYCRNGKKKKRNLFLICARSLRIFSGQEADCSIRAEEERTSKHPA